jgi:hypothetical protein
MSQYPRSVLSTSSYRSVALEVGWRGLIFMYKNFLWLQEKDEGEGGRKMNGEEEEGKEEREQELQLLYAVITALGLAWPSNRETQVDSLR